MAIVLSVTCPSCAESWNFKRPDENFARMVCPKCGKSFHISIPALEDVRPMELDPALTRPPRPTRTYTPVRPVQAPEPALTTVQAKRPSSSGAGTALAMLAFTAILMSIAAIGAVTFFVARDQQPLAAEPAKEPVGGESVFRAEHVFERTAERQPSDRWKPLTPARTEQLKRDVEREAAIITNALVNEDYDLVIDRTYQPLVTASGGASTMIRALETESSRKEDAGMTLRRGKVGKCFALEEKQEYTFALVPMTLVYDQVDGDSWVRKDHLLAISTDRSNWQFVNCDNSNHFIRRIIPQIPPSLKLPSPVEGQLLSD